MCGAEALSPNLPFRIASVTKPYAAGAIMRLMEEGGLDLQQPVESLVSRQTSDVLLRGGYQPGVFTVGEHPDYDAFWRDQAVDKILAARPLRVPMLHVHSQWDAEDSYGPMAVHAAMEAQAGAKDKNFLVIGPWSHPGVGFDEGATLGALKFGSNTARWFREHVLRAFLDEHLRPEHPTNPVARVTAFETGTNTWHTYQAWPQAGAQDCPHPWQPVYFQRDAGLAFQPPPAVAEGGFDEYLSDPAKPVTYQLRPIRARSAPGSTWNQWLVDDQRFAGDRPDVLTYCSPMLTEPLRLAGQPMAHLFASTSGTDSDWIVKLIDVYPDEVPGDMAMGGYQLPIAMEILRGRYRDDPSRPSPIPSGDVVHYTLALPHVSHAFLPGHRIMVQVQSTWFPLYDRNPQRFVENIFFARPEDFIKATQRVFRRADAASRLDLPIVPR